MADFKDNFSKQAEIYARYRPTYPPALFHFLRTLTEKHDLAVDCGTGNGQAAVALTEFYKTIVAVDPSIEQLKHASNHSQISYYERSAHQLPVSDGTTDLITAATAMHWFDLNKFYPEVKRVLKKDGILAIWGYTVQKIEPFLDDLLHDFQFKTLKDYWAPENQIVVNEYKNISFTYDEIECPDFCAEKIFDLDDLIGYINTWSAVQKFLQKNNYNPTDELRDELLDYWKTPQNKKRVEWKIAMRVGRYN